MKIKKGKEIKREERDIFFGKILGNVPEREG